MGTCLAVPRTPGSECSILRSAYDPGQDRQGLVRAFLTVASQCTRFNAIYRASFPPESALQLRDLLVDLTGRSMAAGFNRVVLRKLYIAVGSLSVLWFQSILKPYQLTALAIHLCPTTPSKWPDWPQSTIQALSTLGASTESVLDFIAIIAEEIESVDLLPPQKYVFLVCSANNFSTFPRSRIRGMLVEAAPMVTQAIQSCISQSRPYASPNELRSALKCFEAWLSFLRAESVFTVMLPNLTLIPRHKVTSLR